jgi:hypothetical protein
MHLIHRPYRRLHKSEKFLAVILFMMLFVICIYSVATAPPTNKTFQKTQEKYYTIVLSEHEVYQLKKVIETYHDELPGPMQEIQYPLQ